MRQPFDPEKTKFQLTAVKSSKTPSAAYREVDMGIDKAIARNEPITINIEWRGSSHTYNITNPYERAELEYISELAYGWCNKDSEPEGWQTYQLIQKALGSALPKQIVSIDDSGFITWRELRDPKDNDILYKQQHHELAVEDFNARMEYREMVTNRHIEEIAPKLISAYEQTFGESTMDGHLHRPHFDYLLGLIGMVCKLSRIDCNTLQWKLFKQYGAPFKTCLPGLKERIMDAIRL